MALLGVQLVVTLTIISVSQKLGTYFSFGRYLLCSTGLIRYLYPTNSELKQLANIPKEKGKNRKSKSVNNHYNNPQNEVFHIPRNIDVNLDTVQITQRDIVFLKYYPEYQWLLDFTIYTSIVYIITEVCQVYFNFKEELNLSMLWCSLVLIFSLKILFSLTLQYFKSDKSIGERTTCIIMGFTYLVISMMILIVDENILEIGLEKAYTHFNHSASEFLNHQGIQSTGPASKIIIKFFTAVFCGLLGGVFTFPGLRVAKMHWDLLNKYQDNKFVQVLFNIIFVLPFILVISWIKPISRDYLTVRIFNGMTEPLLSSDTFEILRIVTIILTMFLKIIIMPWYLQSYLDMAYHRIEQQKKEAGRITNIEYQKKISDVFYYLCVATLQYLTPIIICLILSFMLKTLGELSWSSLLGGQQLYKNSTISSSSLNPMDSLDPFSDKSKTNINDLHLALDHLRSIFSTIVLRGLLEFWTWWCCFLYFATSLFGFLYQSYFSIS